MKRTVRILSIAVLALVSFTNVKAQQEVMFTQYMFNGLALNPAYAGSHDALSATGLYRTQWTNFEGSPVSQTFSLHSPVGAQPMGLGFQVVHDKIGVSEETNLYGSYAYWIPMESGKLAFGLQAGVNFFSAGLSDLNVKHTTDQDFSGGDARGTKPNFGGGLYYYSDRYYLGLSVPRLVQNEFANEVSDVTLKQKRHYFLSGGYVLDLGPNWKFKPNFLLKTVQGAPIELDLNANFLFIERVWLGASWRSFDSFDLLTQVYVTPQLSVGYAFDMTTTDIRQYSNGSHEIMVNYIFRFDDERMLTPRFF